MNKIVLTFFSFFILNAAVAQTAADKEQQDLEKERSSLKKELEEKQRLLDKNKKLTKQNLSQLALIRSKVDLQQRVIKNINKDIDMLDNNIVRSQKDVRKLSLLLDTLKQQYATSMIYSYKNRSNADFLNFIFSASSFNDAIRRIQYLKSYRSYREMQGENILRTQGLLKNQIGVLNSNKNRKDDALQTQSKEMNVLADQQKEQNDVVSKLKSEGKELNKQIAARKKQMQKVNVAIKQAILKAQEDARLAAEKERKKRLAETQTQTNVGPNDNSIKGVKGGKGPAPVRTLSNLPSEDVKLNADFVRNKGGLPWPVSKGYVIMEFGSNKLPNGVIVDNPGLTIGSDIGSSVKAVFDGEVCNITPIEDMQVVIIKHGLYFTTYSNLNSVTVSRGQKVTTGQVIGRVASNDEGVGAMDLIISNDKGNQNPRSWLRHQ
ncbi:murein hydrolase activator EnvC family protein [Ferruginibacter albus]|uniref:murein hydrolase activator EnvC family protein n=1 Tax=Ferruginibacter albus TaxID=2875540 RepID=UPI001CC5ABBF|nr:peptidoglycan DD-metalloendopeptidase family protein [Ferruginibacter albus]UAY51412.1 peptidoglycan DD-metalloendopeptidase family protein [Ferruginibacter albus]